MASTYEHVVNSFYLAYYGRPADPAGLAFWSQQLERVGGDFTQIQQAFSTSDESMWRFGSATVSERLTQIYRELFERDPDPAGLDFWVKAINAGSATLAQAAMAVMQGAQGTDKSLNDKRLAVSEQFTAAVNSSKTDYSGTAALEAGRLLLQSVTNTTSDADTKAMVDATLRLSAVASKSPAVIDALASKGTLDSLLSSAKASADPVTFVQVLAKTAELAQGSTSALETLLRGGGMEKVLSSMPATTTLADVEKALDKGGVAAAVDVVYPTTPTTPTTPVFVDTPATGTLAVAGTYAEGAALTASLTATDVDGAVTVAYKWQEKVGANWVDIVGANAATLNVPADQSFVGKEVRVVATTTDVQGGQTTFQTVGQVIANVDDAATGTLTVTGTAAEGGQLQAALGAVVDADGATTVAYKWQMNVAGTWTDIPAANTATLAIPSDQSYVGKEVRVVATTTDALGGHTVFNGNAQTIANVDDAATGTLGVTGTFAEGATVTAAVADLADVDGSVTVAYQWQEEIAGVWTNIVGQTNAALNIPADQSYVGKNVRVIATSTDAFNGHTVWTGDAHLIANVDDGATGTLGVTGTFAEGATVTASVADLADADGGVTVAYQWQEDVEGVWTNIAGQTNAALNIPADQSYVGKSVRVVATSTDAFNGHTVWTGSAHQIANVDDAATGTLGVTGTFAEGATVTASVADLADVDGSVTVAYQWQEEVAGVWTNIVGQTNAALEIPADQSYVGKNVRVVATSTDAFNGHTVWTGDAHLIANVDDAATGTLGVTGTFAEGATVTAGVANLADVDGGVSVAYQWQEQVDGNWVNLAGQTGASLQIPADQSYVDKVVRVQATTTDAFGGHTVFTSNGQTVQNVDDAATVDELSFSGVAEQGGSLTVDLVNLVDQDGTTTTAYQWQVFVAGAWTNISGATTDTLDIPDDKSLVFSQVRVVATTTDARGGESVFESAPLTVANVDHAATGTLGLYTGYAYEGGQVFANRGTVTDPDGAINSATYQWQVDVNGTWTNIDGAVGDVLSVPADQSLVNKTVRVVGEMTDAYGGHSTVVSAGTVIANVDDVATGTLGVAGTYAEGATLTASIPDLHDDDGAATVAYKWQVLNGTWTDINGATSAAYTLPSDQSYVGKQVRVVATTTDALGGHTVFTSLAQLVTNVDDAATGTLTVTGTFEEGATVTASIPDLADADGAASVAYQWQENVAGVWTNIVGANNAALAIPSDQSYVGKEVRVVATTTDVLGGHTTFNGDGHVIANVNDAPVLAHALGTQNATQGQAFSFVVPANTFDDVDGDTLAYYASVPSNDPMLPDLPLPAWLNFDATTRTFSGTPGNGDVGPVSIKVTVADGHGGVVSNTFTLNQIDLTPPAQPTVAMATADNTGLTTDNITNKASVTLAVGAIEAGGRAWLDKDGNNTYDAGVDVLADGSGNIANVSLAIGANSFRVINQDAQNNTSYKDVLIVRDTAAPDRDVTTPVNFTSTTDGAYTVGDTITLMFGEPVVWAQVNGAWSVSGGHNLGTGATIMPVDLDANGYVTQVRFTVGTGATVVYNDTITFNKVDVVDVANNQALNNVVFTLPRIPDTIPPVFASATASVNVNENLSTLYTAQATDGSTIAYSLKAGGDAALLAIDSVTGAVTLQSGLPLDYETKTSYSFTVIATDLDNNASEQAVTVGINNLDEIAPTITSAATANVNENVGEDHLVYTVTSTDGGDVSNGVTYSFKDDPLNPDDHAALTINPTTGAVTLNGNPDFETKDTYVFTVVATDAAHNASEQTVTLSINDLDDTPPLAPDVNLNVDSGVNEVRNSEITNDATLAVTAELGALIEYRVGTVSGGSTTWGNWGTTYDKPTTNGSYTVEVRATDADNNTSPVTSLSFTVDVTKPTMDAVLPFASVTKSYAGGSDFTIKFAEPVRVSNLVPGNFGVDNTHNLGGAGLAITPTDAVGGFATTFTLTLGAGATLAAGDHITIGDLAIEDIAGNYAAANAVLTAPDVTAPVLNRAGSTPADNATSNTLQDKVVLKFDEPISAALSNLSKVYLKDSADHIVSATAAVVGSTIEITPAANLVLGEGYYVVWDANAISDTVGNYVAALSDKTIYNFTGAGPFVGTVADVVALNPLTQVPHASSLTVVDSAAAISAANFTAGNLADVGTIRLADGDTNPVHFTVSQLSNQTVVLQQNEGSFAVRDTANALANLSTQFAGVTGDLPTFEIRDSVTNLFTGNALSSDFVDAVTNLELTQVEVTGGALNLVQAQNLRAATANEIGGDDPSTLFYNLTDTAAVLLAAQAANGADLALVNGANDTDVTSTSIGAVKFADLVTLYGLIDEAPGPHDQTLTYALTATAADLYTGDALKAAAAGDYLPNATSVNVVGASVNGTQTVQGATGTQEQQTLTVTPQVGDIYRLTWGGTTLFTHALADTTVAGLVAALQQSPNYATGAFTVAAAGSDIVLTFKADSDQAAAVFTKESGLDVAQAVALNDKVAETGDNLTAATYDLTVHASELVNAYDTAGATRSALSAARDITVVDAMTVVQAGRFTNITNPGFKSYNITDTAAQLASGSAVITNARDLTVTDLANAAQANTIYGARGTSGVLHYSVYDYVGNIASGGVANAMSAAENITAYGSVSAAQATTVVNYTNSGYTQFSNYILDNVASMNTFIDTYGPGAATGNVLRTYTYQVSDNAANIASAAINTGDTLHVLRDASMVYVTNAMDYSQASTLVNSLEVAAPALLAQNKVNFTMSDTIANLGNDHIWMNGDVVLNDANRASKYADYIEVRDTAANIAAVQNANGVIDGGDLEVFQRIQQVGGSVYATGSAGNQTIAGGDWHDQLDGGDGNDTLYGNNGSDTLVGGNGADLLYGGEGRDTLYAGTGAGTGSVDSYWQADKLYGGNGGDNMFGSGTSGNNDRDLFIYAGHNRAELIAESGTTAVSRDYINNMGYGDGIVFENVNHDNVFFYGTANFVPASVAAGTFALSISYDRNIQVADFADTGLVTATKVKIDIADADGKFDGVADMTIILVGNNVDVNWTWDSNLNVWKLGFGA